LKRKGESFLGGYGNDNIPRLFLTQETVIMKSTGRNGCLVIGASSNYPGMVDIFVSVRDGPGSNAGDRSYMEGTGTAGIRKSGKYNGLA
jgi:hypothetical protein